MATYQIIPNTPGCKPVLQIKFSVNKSKSVKKNTLFYNLLFVLAVSMASCTQSSKETTENQTDSVSISNPVPATSVNADGLLMTILKTENGMARGIQLGDKIEKVTATEKVEMTQDSTFYQGYTEYFNDSDEEFVDVMYYFDKAKKINTINLDVYLNKQAESNKLMGEFKNYFITKYGAIKQNGKQAIWTLPQGKLYLEDKSVKNLPGFRIQFTSLGEIREVE